MVRQELVIGLRADKDSRSLVREHTPDQSGVQLARSRSRSLLLPAPRPARLPCVCVCLSAFPAV